MNQINTHRLGSFRSRFWRRRLRRFLAALAIAGVGVSAGHVSAALVEIGELHRIDGGSLTHNTRNDAFRANLSGGAVANLGETVNLASVGDYIQLSFNIVRNTVGNNQQNTVRFGLFNSNGSPVTTDDQTSATDDWLGYFPSLTTRNGGTENAFIKEQAAGTGIVLAPSTTAGTGVSNLGASAPSGIDQSSVNNGLINLPMTLRIERTASGLDISGGPFQSEAAPTLETRSDASPVTTSFNGLALAFGSGGAIVSDIQVDTNVTLANPAGPAGLPAGAAFVLLENFDGQTSGASLNTLPNWTATTGSGGTARVDTDPADAANLVGFVGDRSVNARLSDAALNVADNGAGTLFLRSQFTLLADGDTMNFGLGTSTGSPLAGAGASSGGLRPGGFNNPTQPLLEDTWYNVWIVADSELDLVSIYLQSDDDANFLTQTLFRTAPFNAAFPDASILDRVVFSTGNVPNSPRMFFDDIYFSARGINLNNPLDVTSVDPSIPEPATFTLLAGVSLMGLLRRRHRAM